MAVKVGEAFVELTAPLGEYNKNINQAEDKLAEFDRNAKATSKNISSSMGGIAKAAIGVFAAFQTINFVLGDVIKAASDFEETNNKFKVTFKGVGDEAEKMAKTLEESYGLSSIESRKLLSNTGDLLTGFGATSKEALDLSSEVQKLAVDLVSFQNVEGGVERASQALTSGLLGEREQLKSLGIVISEAALQQRLLEKGQNNLTGSALLQAKAQATLELATEQSKNSIGDFARSSDSYANQTRIAAAITQDLAVIIGTPLKNALSNSLKDFTSNREEVKQFAEDLAILVTVVAKVAEGFLFIIKTGLKPILAFIKLNLQAVRAISNQLQEWGIINKSTADSMGSVVKGIDSFNQSADTASKKTSALSKEWLKAKREAQQFLKELAQLSETPVEKIQRIQEEQLTQLESYKKRRLITEQEYANGVIAINQETAKQLEEIEQQKLEQKLGYLNKGLEVVQEIGGFLNDILNSQTQNEIGQIESKKKKQIDRLNAEFKLESDNIKNNVKNKKIQEKKLAELEADRDKKQAEIEKKAEKREIELKKRAFEREKAFRIVATIMAGAQAVINALSQQPIIPLGIAMAALATATTIASVASIAAQKPPAFADGGFVSSPTTALVGEDGTEGIFPLQGARGRKTREMFARDLLKETLNIADQEEGTTSRVASSATAGELIQYNINVNIGGETFFGTIQKGINDRQITIDERSLRKR